MSPQCNVYPDGHKDGKLVPRQKQTKTCETDLPQVGKLSYFTLRETLTLMQIDYAQSDSLDLFSEIASGST